MADLQSLIQAFQALGLGTGSVGSPTTSAVPAMPTGGGGDPKAQLMQLLSGAGSPTPAGGGGMLQAIQAMGSDPRSRSSTMIPDDNAEMIRQNANSGANVYNAGAEPMGNAGPMTDSELQDMDRLQDKVRKDRPTPDYDSTGKDKSGKRPMSTEEELDDVQKRMGEDKNDPIGNGDFPPQAEIDALNEGRISPMEFDKKWGKGAADEMMNEQV